MTKRYGKEVTGICKICEAEGYTEIHHIISQTKCRKMGREDLLTNQNNLIELCKPCHNLTDSSLYAKKLWGERKKRERKKRTRKKQVKSPLKFQCIGHTKRGLRCKLTVSSWDGLCKTHKNQPNFCNGAKAPDNPNEGLIKGVHLHKIPSDLIG